jgi:acyl CoA:acetate/3-ketoacid CoA transferase beta subunit
VAQLRHGSVARQLVLHRSRKSQLLIELVDGVTLDEVKSKTEANFRVALKNT